MLMLKSIFKIILLLLFFIIPTEGFGEELPLPVEGQGEVIQQALEKEGVSFSDNNSVVLLLNGQEKFDDMFEAIRNAKESVHLEYFNFRNDSIANCLFDLLAEKAKEGVEVRALFDSFGNSSNNRPLKNHHMKSIRERGIEIFEFDPLAFPWVNHVWARDHRKIVVIDGRVAYTGGMNVADYYIHGTEQVGEWHDMHCRIQGEEVNTLQTIFLRIWNKTAKQKVGGAKYYHACANADYITRNLKKDTTSTAFKKRLGIANREPGITPKVMRTFYLTAINNAKDSIKLINPYFTLNGKLKRALKNAVKRGVKVEIMLSRNSDIPLTPDCGFYNAHKLMKQGVTVWIFEGGFHHTKIICVDGKFCTVGSTNLDARSLRFDYEENVVILDRETTHQMEQVFDNDKRTRCFLLTKESWNEWQTRGMKTKGWFAHFLASWL